MKRWFTLWLCLLFVAASLAPRRGERKGEIITAGGFFPEVFSNDPFPRGG